MISVAGQVTFDDYFRTMRYHSRKRDATVILSLALCAALAAAATRNVIMPAIVLAYLAIRPVYIRYRLQRNWRQTPAPHRRPMTYGLDETGFHTEDDEGRPVVTHWDSFLKFRESRDTFLVYLSPQLLLYLPKRFIAADDQNRIRELLTRKIRQGPTAKDATLTDST